ncbi:SulP family inorganic anion transporter [Methyloceanibacter sp. wino2]|uniref:SulP family inorganic anion transporter n=1 Tax=Methyloceanibacter sp. wino2 TaxID=2170729 RepID=UPI000D3E9165|nr:SulP family inorganic anion transporter [Methyloceanibacter sp. wino2]
MKPKLITTLQSYTRADFLSDTVAGLTVALVAIPLSIAIAIASGADPAKGIVTVIVAGFLVSLLGGSKVQIGGPTGAFIVVVYGVIAEHGYDGLVLATLMAGIILLIAGALRAGSLIQYIPEAVINGFTIGIAVIIATSQLKDFFGIQVESLPADFRGQVAALWAARDTASLTALVIGVVTLVSIVLLRRVAPRLPCTIIVVAIVSAVIAIFALPADTIVSRYGPLPQTLPMPALPVLSFERVVELLPSALVIAFLAAVESLLSAMVADRMIGSRHRPNAEVIAQGAANVGSALFGGLPATGAIARTAKNVRAGAKTPVAGLIHALAVLVIMLVAAPLAGHLALPALAALLILTAWYMSEPHKWRGYMAERLADRVLLVLTLVLTVLTNLTIAIAVGVALGLAIRLRRRNVPPSDWQTPER